MTYLSIIYLYDISIYHISIFHYTTILSIFTALKCLGALYFSLPLHNAWHSQIILLFIVLPFLKCHITGILKSVVFCAFHVVYFWDSFVLHVSVIYSFLLLKSISLYEYTTGSLSIHQMMDVSVVTSFWLLWIQTAAVNIGTLAPHSPAATNLPSDYRFACLVLIF